MGLGLQGLPLCGADPEVDSVGLDFHTRIIRHSVVRLQGPVLRAKIRPMKLLLVCSLKGGTGKTTVAVGLARALRRTGKKVGILDLDFRTPNVPVVLGGGAEDAELGLGPDDVIVPATVEGLQVVSMAYIWPPERCVEVSDEDALKDVIQMLTPGVIAWCPDFVVLDTPPTATGMVRAALAAPDLIGAVIVSHPSRVARVDTERTIDMFREHQVPVIILVSNMGTDGTGGQMFDLTDADLKAVADRHGIPAFFSLPYVREGPARDALFDQLLRAVLGTEPVLLARREPSDAGWKAAVKLARRVLK